MPGRKRLPFLDPKLQEHLDACFASLLGHQLMQIMADAWGLESPFSPEEDENFQYVQIFCRGAKLRGYRPTLAVAEEISAFIQSSFQPVAPALSEKLRARLEAISDPMEIARWF
jgi:hypothetical protein